MSKKLSVMLVDDTPARAVLLEQALTDLGYQVIGNIRSAEGLLRQVDQHRPDVVIIDTESPDRDMLEHMAIINEHNPTPIIMFSGESNSHVIERAVRAGVSAYVVGGLDCQRVQPILDVAIARFREFQALRQELEQTRTKLADRTLIDRAKVLLMKQKEISEDQAYKAMRQLAMQRSQRLVDVARNIISILELLE